MNKKIIVKTDTEDIYYENQDIISSLESLLDSIEYNKDVYEQLRQIKWDLEDKNSELEKELEDRNEGLESEYWKSQF